MTDFVKELVAAASVRVRSPVYGSIALVFLLSNWKPIYFVLFSNFPIMVRYWYFDTHTTLVSLYLLPFGLGLVIAIAGPWVKFFGAFVAKYPIRRLRYLQDDEESERAIRALDHEARREEAKAKLEEATERRKIEAAKRLASLDEIQSVEVRRDLEKELRDRREREKAEGQDNDADSVDVQPGNVPEVG